MGVIKLLVESTKSRRGSHIARSLAIIIRKDGRLEVAKPNEKCKGTYSRGIAGYAIIKLEEGDLVVWLHFIRNNLGRISGRIKVFDYNGEEILSLTYRKLKIRRVSGDSRYWWAVERVLKYLKIYDKVKRINLNTGV